MPNADITSIREPEFRSAQLQIAALSMAILQDRLGLTDEAGLLLSVETGPMGAAARLAASSIARGMPDEEARTDAAGSHERSRKASISVQSST